MIKKLTLTDVYRLTKDKEGNSLTTKDGKPYTRVLLKAQEYGDKPISGFGNKVNETWKAGDEVTIDVTEVKKGEAVYLNFAPVNMTERMMEMIQELNRRVRKLEIDAAQGFHYPEMKDEHKTEDELNAELDALAQEEVSSEEIPF